MSARDGAPAVSDGTMPCPVPAPETGHPCMKKIPAGWTADEGHAGGHWWQDPAITEMQKRGVHFDYATLLSGQPAQSHEPEDCTPSCWKYGWSGGKR